MAEGWGNVVHHWQSYVEASVTSETATTATITCKTYWHSISWGYSVYGHGYGVIGSTTGTDSGTVVFSSGTGASVYQLLTTMTKTITKTDSSQSVACKGVAIMTGRADANGTSTATCTVSIPAIAYESPNAPSGCSATRNSDTKATVKWTNGSTSTTKPRTATLVERSTDGGSWAQVASVGSSATSYTDNGIGANHRYIYRVRASNTAGKSGYSTSGYIYTTPAAPASVTASKTSASSVQVSITGAAPYASAYDVAATTDGGATWDVIAQPTSMPYVDADAPAGTVQYRVRATRGSLASAWTTGNELVTITPPLAPTITGRPGTPTSLGSTVIITWAPNHPDGSAQSMAQVMVTSPGGSTSTYSVSGSATSYELTTDEAGTWSAQVRTHGLYDGWGEWSDAISWGVYAPPEVVITSPAVDGTVIRSLPITVAWEVSDQTGVSQQGVTLEAPDGVVYSATPASDATSIEIGAHDAPLANGTEYVLAVTVTGGSGLVASAERRFDTDWAPPMEPTAMVGIDAELMQASVTVFPGEASADLPSGTPETTSLMVARVMQDGSRWVVGTDLESGDTVIDPLPPLGVPYSYEITASAETGATAVTSYTERISSRAWVLNFGADAAEALTLYGNPKESYSLDTNGEAYHFADGGKGGGMPVYYGLAERDRSGTLTFDTVGHEDADRLEALCDANPVGWLRNPFGKRWRCSMVPKVSHGVGEVWQVSIGWDGGRWEEARVG